MSGLEIAIDIMSGKRDFSDLLPEELDLLLDDDDLGEAAADEVVRRFRRQQRKQIAWENHGGWDDEDERFDYDDPYDRDQDRYWP